MQRVNLGGTDDGRVGYRIVLARAPHRISLGGGGTDLPAYYARSGGHVIAAAIDHYVHVAVGQLAAENGVLAHHRGGAEEVDAAGLADELLRFAFETVGIGGGIEVTSVATLPPGTGLGSSGSFLSALLAALVGYSGKRLSKHELAELAYEIEAVRGGRPVGKQDHYATTLGGVVALSIEPDGSVDAQAVPISRETTEALEAQLLLFYTGIRRDAAPLLRVQQDAARADGAVRESLDLSKRLSFQIREALTCGEVDAIGPIFHAHWVSKRRRAPGISSPAVDHWYELACANGATGGKLVGAGGGGFLLLACPPAAAQRLRLALAREGLRHVGWRLDEDGAKVVYRA